MMIPMRILMLIGAGVCGGALLGKFLAGASSMFGTFWFISVAAFIAAVGYAARAFLPVRRRSTERLDSKVE